MEYYEYYYDYASSDYECRSVRAHVLQYVFNLLPAQSICPAIVSSMDELHDKNSGETLQRVCHVFWTILPALFFFALARMVTHFVSKTRNSVSVLRFIIEFIVIVLPTVVSVNLLNSYVEYFVAAMCTLLALLFWRSGCWRKAQERKYALGMRPQSLTLCRSTINFLTALCILAIDFESFPRLFRKSRHFGAGLMDVGIGLFVFSMGSVSRRPRRAGDWSRLVRTVAPILILGLARTVVIMYIDYHQDEHEYGVHLNAFFTLGLTKLFATIISALATADVQLLPLGLVSLFFWAMPQFRRRLLFLPSFAYSTEYFNGSSPYETLRHVWHIFWTIVPALFFFALARIVTHFVSQTRDSITVTRFLIEFILIALPTVLSVNVANSYVEYFVAAMFVLLTLLFWRSGCWGKAKERKFILGTRPYMLTLARSTINFLTALCILAIDFESFPTKFRKSRRFGVGLMDVGIGLFVFSMGSVSRRPLRSADWSRLARTVVPMLILGLARTVVIMYIDYHQDEHEYGLHLNAFFTLGFTKLFGTVASTLANADKQLLPLGFGILAIHETALQFGLSDFVMDKYMERDTLIRANREGICSLPGFVGIYLISIYIGQWLQTKSILNFKQFMHKLKAMAFANISIWLLVISSAYAVGIARVTCNFGYAVWILAIALTMIMLFTIVFGLILNTLWPVSGSQAIMAAAGGDSELMLPPTKQTEANQDHLQIPTLVDAINLNGLTFFLLANVLTGGVNIFFNPEDRTDFESVVILSLYMLLSIGFVYILYRLKIRIA